MVKVLQGEKKVADATCRMDRSFVAVRHRPPSNRLQPRLLRQREPAARRAGEDAIRLRGTERLPAHPRSHDREGALVRLREGEGSDQRDGWR